MISYNSEYDTTTGKYLSEKIEAVSQNGRWGATVFFDTPQTSLEVGGQRVFLVEGRLEKVPSTSKGFVSYKVTSDSAGVFVVVASFQDGLTVLKEQPAKVVEDISLQGGEGIQIALAKEGALLKGYGYASRNSHAFRVVSGKAKELSHSEVDLLLNEEKAEEISL
jgi:hypothetical protein